MSCKTKHPRCPYCNSKLEDAGNYKWDCPNNCFRMPLELWQIEAEVDYPKVITKITR